MGSAVTNHESETMLWVLRNCAHDRVTQLCKMFQNRSACTELKGHWLCLF